MRCLLPLLLVLPSCGVISKVSDGFDKANQVVERYGPAVEKVATHITEQMPRILDAVDKLTKIYEAYKPQIDKLVPEAEQLLKSLRDVTDKASGVSVALVEAKAKATRPDGSIDWMAYLAALAAAAYAEVTRRKASASTEILHERVEKRKEEVGGVAERLRALEEAAIRAEPKK